MPDFHLFLPDRLRGFISFPAVLRRAVGKIKNGAAQRLSLSSCSALCNSAPHMKNQRVALYVQRHDFFRYLNDFRVDPCALFKQHTCQQHRPYGCFYWHFANQRRRKCFRRKDGTFNYSADMYCTKYDENTGVCPDGDECPFLHRVHGDVERKYHLRYYKTTMCVHPTDAKGNCARNGQHCAFAHGPDDLRSPVFDIKEVKQQNEDLSYEMFENRDRLSYVIEDPVWQDHDYVLAYYKTDLCKKPPRLCRQGYACPYYHNSKDKRRSPGEYKYRSTPCPGVKHGDEWCNPETCEEGDRCGYCHTRTEQQFHPEIYKSTKCNDMLQHGYCPRGPFCAFAHTDEELHAIRDLPKRPSLTDSTSSLVNKGVDIYDSDKASGSCLLSPVMKKSSVGSVVSPASECLQVYTTFSTTSSNPSGDSMPSYSTVLMQRHGSLSLQKPSNTGSESGCGELSSSYPKAPGFERIYQFSPRKDRGGCTDFGAGPPSGEGAVDPDSGRLKSALYACHEIGWDMAAAAAAAAAAASPNSPTTGQPTSAPGLLSVRHNSGSPLLSVEPGAASYPTMDNADSLLGSLMEDISLDDLSLPTISENEERIEATPPFMSQDANVNAMFGSSSPVMIPRSSVQSSVLREKSCTPNSPRSFGNLYGLFAAADDHSSMFQMSAGSASGDHLYLKNLDRMDSVHNRAETRLQEPTLTRLNGSSLEETLKQARKACEAWKREADDQRHRAQLAEFEKSQAIKERDSALSQLAYFQVEMQMMHLGSVSSGTIDFMNRYQLEQLKRKLYSEIDKIEKQLQQNPGPMCARCGRHVNDKISSNACSVCCPGGKTSNGHFTAVS